MLSSCEAVKHRIWRALGIGTRSEHMEEVVPVKVMWLPLPCLYLFPPGFRQLSQTLQGSLKPEKWND